MNLFAAIDALPGDDPGTGRWLSYATQARWDPEHSRNWHCWYQTGPTWSTACGTEVLEKDTLGLCVEHRRLLLDGAE